VLYLLLVFIFPSTTSSVFQFSSFLANAGGIPTVAISCFPCLFVVCLHLSVNSGCSSAVCRGKFMFPRGVFGVILGVLVVLFIYCYTIIFKYLYVDYAFNYCMPHQPAPKSSDTEPIKKIRSAEKLADDTSNKDDVDLSPESVKDGEIDSEMMALIKQQITNSKHDVIRSSTRAAKNEAKKEEIESELELASLERRKKESESPVQRSSPIVGGLGGGRSAIVLAALQAIPESERAEFIKENRELLFSPDSSLSSILGATKDQKPVASGGNDMLSVAALIQAMGEETRRNSLLQLELRKHDTTAPPVVPQQNGTSMADIMTLVTTLTTANNANLEKVLSTFTSSQQALTNEIKSMREAAATTQNSMERQLLDARKELISKDIETRDKLMLDAINELKTQRSVDKGVPITQLPELLKNLEAAGMKFRAEDGVDKEAQLKYDLEHAKLGVAAEEAERRHEEEMMRLESSGKKTELLKDLIHGGLEATLFNRNVKKGGSESGKAVASRMEA